MNETFSGGDISNINDAFLSLSGSTQLPTQIDPSLMEMMPLIKGYLLFFNLWSVITFLLCAWGLYMINKKLGEKYPWLAFIPVVQYYTYYTAGDTSFRTYFIYPLLILILSLILAPFTF